MEKNLMQISGKNSKEFALKEKKSFYVKKICYLIYGEFKTRVKEGLIQSLVKKIFQDLFSLMFKSYFIFLKNYFVGFMEKSFEK